MTSETDVVDTRDAEIHPDERRVTIVGHCKDCKHWGRGASIDPADWFPNKRKCAMIGDLGNLIGRDADLATVEISCERGPVEMWTATSFGCVLWEAKT